MAASAKAPLRGELDSVLSPASKRNHETNGMVRPDPKEERLRSSGASGLGRQSERLYYRGRWVKGCQERSQRHVSSAQ